MAFRQYSGVESILKAGFWLGVSTMPNLLDRKISSRLSGLAANHLPRTSSDVPYLSAVQNPLALYSFYLYECTYQCPRTFRLACKLHP